MNAHQVVATAVQILARSDSPSGSQWITVDEAARRARCGIKLIYREVRAGRLRASRVGGRRELRLLGEWVDEWPVRHATSR
jgi:excisionase family DNA binding protein